MTAPSKGVRWAHIGMGIGGVASILANVAARIPRKMYAVGYCVVYVGGRY